MTRILVIDDDKSVCMAIETLLRNHDCVTVLANSSRLGTQAFEQSNFDVVMIDIFMPEIDGLETIKEFRKRAPDIPIVAMSGFRFRNTMAPTPDYMEMASELGATHCLRKPFGPQQLLAAINSCLGVNPQAAQIA